MDETHGAEKALTKAAEKGNDLGTLIRVYNNGDRVTTPHATRELVQYSVDFRPGCALFLDGTIVQTGYLSRERCEEITRELRENAGGTNRE